MIKVRFPLPDDAKKTKYLGDTTLQVTLERLSGPLTYTFIFM
jgi:hypothetical protein